MQGNFERDTNVYPIGYMITGETNTKGPLVNIVDMRDLSVICKTELTGGEVYSICAELNASLEAGASVAELKATAEYLVTGVVIPEVAVLASVSESEVPAQDLLPPDLKLPAFPKVGE